MRLGTGGAGDFPHFDSPRQQRIRYQGAMTAPGNGFGAHDRDPLRSCKFYQFVQMLPKLGRLHIVGEATEARVMPAGVDRIRARAPEAAKSGHVPVMKAGGMQGRRQLASVELRIVPRTRDGSYIDQPLYLVRFQELDEFLYRAGRVPDGHDNRRGWQGY
jgi:hypothetical protein